MLTLENTIIFATQAHMGMRDKSGRSYILHPLSVMMRMDTDAERITALLHDVLEDCPSISLEDIRRDLKATQEILIALTLLTKTKGCDYDVYIEGIKDNPLACKVKIADLEHNMDLTRTLGRRNMTEKDMLRMAKYYKSWSYLTGK